MEESTPPRSLIHFVGMQDQEGNDSTIQPLKNGVVERKNKYIMETAKAMIHDLDLPTFLWEKACNMALYILNRHPHKILKDKTLEEVFTGGKPQASHFRIFGCPMYIHAPDGKRSKLEPSSLKGIFVRILKGLQRLDSIITKDSGEKFDEKAWSFRSLEPPRQVEEGKKLVVPNDDPQISRKSDLDQRK
jgi:hypothetical protein